MIIQRFAEFVMRGRKEAALMALVWTIVPFMGWLGIVIMAFVTLRKGALEGLFVLLWVALPSVVFVFIGYPKPLMYNVLYGGVVVWVLALILRETQSWSALIQAAALIGILGVIAVHLFVPDIGAYWYKLLTTYYTDAKKTLALKLTAADLKNAIKVMASVATGVQVGLILFVNLINLGIARWLQSLLYNPGGLSKELFKLRLGYVANVLLIVVTAAVLFNIKLAWDIFPLVLLLFFTAGLILIHVLAAMTKAVWAWLIGFYFLLIIFFPYIAGFVIALAIADTWINFRHKLQAYG